MPWLESLAGRRSLEMVAWWLKARMVIFYLSQTAKGWV